MILNSLSSINAIPDSKHSQSNGPRMRLVQMSLTSGKTSERGNGSGSLCVFGLVVRFSSSSSHKFEVLSVKKGYTLEELEMLFSGPPAVGPGLVFVKFLHI